MIPVYYNKSSHFVVNILIQSQFYSQQDRSNEGRHDGGFQYVTHKLKSTTLDLGNSYVKSNSITVALTSLLTVATRLLTISVTSF